MAARLEWIEKTLCLGVFPVASIRIAARGRIPLWEYVINTADEPIVGMAQESAPDAQQDCESEVRRLLKEVGVECE